MEEIFQFQTVSFLESTVQQVFGNLKSNEIVIGLRCVVAAGHLQDVETELRFQVRRRIVRIGHFVSKLPSQLGIKQGHGSIHSDRMAVHIRAIVCYRAKRERVFLKVPRLIQQSLEKIGAPHVMQQIAEEMAAKWIVAQVLNDAPAVSVTMGFFELLLAGFGKMLDQDRLDRVDPKRIDDGLMSQHRVTLRVGRETEQDQGGEAGQYPPVD